LWELEGEERPRSVKKVDGKPKERSEAQNGIELDSGFDPTT
jgi:hypothetical protein